MSSNSTPLVLCYHAVSDEWNHTLSVSPAALRRQMRLVLARRYRPVAAGDVLGSGRVVHVTFDDAFRSVLSALPMLDELHVPTTVFVCSGYADHGVPLAVPELADEARDHPRELATMDWDTLRELAERGVEVGSHTMSHAHLSAVSDDELAWELRESRERIESQIGRPCRFLAYPYGEHDARVRAAARSCGYEAAFSLAARNRPLDRFALPRVGVWRHDGLLRTTLKTSAARYAIAALHRTMRRARLSRTPLRNDQNGGRGR